MPNKKRNKKIYLKPSISIGSFMPNKKGDKNKK
jgi:hypothetical protein